MLRDVWGGGGCCYDSVHILFSLPQMFHIKLQAVWEEEEEEEV